MQIGIDLGGVLNITPQKTCVWCKICYSFLGRQEYLFRIALTVVIVLDRGSKEKFVFLPEELNTFEARRAVNSIILVFDVTEVK